MDAPVVLDASAVSALVKGEDGGEIVSARCLGAVISAVNFSEVVEMLARIGLPIDVWEQRLASIGIGIVAFSSEQATTTAALRPPTRPAGLSLADRACLALALELDAPVLTADRAWSKLDVGVEIELIR